MRADAETERAVLAALERLNDVFAAKSVEAGVALFGGHQDAVMFGSEDYEVARGPAEIAGLMERLFEYPMTFQWRWDATDVRRAGDVAWVAAESTVLVVSDEGQEETPYRVTAVFVRRDGDWGLVHFHGTQPVATG